MKIIFECPFDKSSYFYCHINTYLMHFIFLYILSLFLINCHIAEILMVCLLS